VRGLNTEHKKELVPVLRGKKREKQRERRRRAQTGWWNECLAAHKPIVAAYHEGISETEGLPDNS
jgi:hypothetical protein